MAVKIFLGTIMFVSISVITGLAMWFFPVLDKFHQAMGGDPMKDPRGDWKVMINDYLSFLPDNALVRAGFVCGIIVLYLFVSSILTLLAYRIHQRRKDRDLQKLSKVQTIHAYNSRRS